jgi:hypothetical protein
VGWGSLWRAGWQNREPAICSCWGAAAPGLRHKLRWSR